MLARDDSCAFTEALGSEHLAANWSDKLLPNAGLGAAKKAPENLGGLLGWNYGRHEPFATPELCL